MNKSLVWITKSINRLKHLVEQGTPGTFGRFWLGPAIGIMGYVQNVQKGKKWTKAWNENNCLWSPMVFSSIKIPIKTRKKINFFMTYFLLLQLLQAHGIGKLNGPSGSMGPFLPRPSLCWRASMQWYEKLLSFLIAWCVFVCADLGVALLSGARMNTSNVWPSTQDYLQLQNVHKNLQRWLAGAQARKRFWLVCDCVITVGLL